MNKIYGHEIQLFFGHPLSGPCYLIEVDEENHYRYLFDDGRETNWEKIEPYYQKAIDNGIWVEIKELPAKPWIIKNALDSVE